MRGTSSEFLLPSPVPCAVRGAAVVDPDQRGRHRAGDQPAVGVTAEVLEGTAAYDPADICSADSVQSVSPDPVNHPWHPQTFGGIPGLTGTAGMADLSRNLDGIDGR